MALKALEDGHLLAASSPLITVIPDRLLYWCNIFSLELPENITEILDGAFYKCFCLRNVAFPPNAVFEYNYIYNIFDEATDLLLLFGSDAEIFRELQHRFDELPIHCIVYYQTYYHGVLQILIDAMNTRSDPRQTLHTQLNPTGNQQDCLGMTPLHVLACSSVHDLEMYRVIVENYPTNLITEDRWGALPLLYAFWGDAPAKIMQFLIESYQSLYSSYKFDWTLMVEAMGRCDSPKERIENLIRVKQIYFPEQPLDWDYLLEKFALPTKHSFGGLPFQERMQFLFMCGLSESVDALVFKLWRDHITIMIRTANFNCNGDNLGVLRSIQEKLAYFEDEISKLNEITTILELALWTMKMNEKSHQEIATHSQKKIKTVESSTRQQCRLTCGADVVIGHVLPFLIAA
jgi:hypothetical protein